MNNNIFGNYKDAVNRKQLQEILGIGKSLAYKLLQSGEIKSKKVGREYKIPKQYIIEYLQGN